MNVTLPPDLERRIAEKIAQGDFPDASQVIQAGLTLLFEAEDSPEEWAARMRADIQIGLDELDQGETIPGDQVFEEMRALIEAKRPR